MHSELKREVIRYNTNINRGKAVMIHLNAEYCCHKIVELREIFGWFESATMYFALIKRGLEETGYRGLFSLKCCNGRKE